MDVLYADALAWTFIFIDNYTPLIDLHCWLVKSRTAPFSFEIQVVDGDVPREGRTPSGDTREYMGWLIPTISLFLTRCHPLHLVTTAQTASIILLNYFNRLRLPLLHRLTIDVTPIPMSLQRLPGFGRSRMSIPARAIFPSLTEMTFYKSLPLWHWASAFRSISIIRLHNIYGADSPQYRSSTLSFVLPLWSRLSSFILWSVRQLLDASLPLPYNI
jgi:hypothetical protein